MFFPIVESNNDYPHEDYDTLHRAWRVVFQRDPSTNGWNYWVNKYQQNGLMAVLTTWCSGPEAAALFNDRTDREIVQELFRRTFNREPGEAAIHFWSPRQTLSNRERARLVRHMVTSVEAKNKMPFTYTAAALDAREMPGILYFPHSGCYSKSVGLYRFAWGEDLRVHAGSARLDASPEGFEVNGNWYTWRGPIGYVRSFGRSISGWENDPRAAAIVTRTDLVTLITTGGSRPSHYHAAAGKLLLNQGEYYDKLDEDSTLSNIRHRTFAGVYPDGKVMLGVTQRGSARGVADTISAWTQCSNAVMLDGGGSSGMTGPDGLLIGSRSRYVRNRLEVV